MAIEAKVVADSISTATRKRIVTFVLTYPWFIHWDLLTHRQLSRNAMSSRAMPIWKCILRVLQDPAMPLFWGMNGKGMQARAELPRHKRWLAKGLWVLSCYFSVGIAWLLSKLGLHKQDTNKILTPYMHITTIVTATEWGNFFNLRAHPDAHPTFQALADAMLSAYTASVPVELEPGEWHLPFADKYVPEGLDILLLLKIVTARCARVSYMTFDGDIDHDKDYGLHDDLMQNGHMSPFEHAGRCEATASRSGNFIGYTQYRKLIPNEERVAFDPEALLLQRKQHGE